MEEGRHSILTFDFLLGFVLNFDGDLIYVGLIMDGGALF